MANKPKIIGKLRHWKQRFKPNAAFVWRRRCLFQGKMTEIGMPIPDVLVKLPTKLRRFWESRVIELAEFDAPNVATGVVEKPEKVVYQEGQHIPVDGLGPNVTIHKAKGSWFAITVGDKVHKVNGQKNLDEAIDTLREHAKAAEEQAKADAEAQAKADAKAAAAETGSDGGDAPTD